MRQSPYEVGNQLRIERDAAVDKLKRAERERDRLRERLDAAEAERDTAIQCMITTLRVQRSDGIQNRWVDVFTVCGHEFRDRQKAKLHALSLIQPKRPKVTVTDDDGEAD